jgi:hypothetical protein
MLPVVLTTKESVKYVSLADDAIDEACLTDDIRTAYRESLDTKLLPLRPGCKPETIEIRGLTPYEFGLCGGGDALGSSLFEICRRGIVAMDALKGKRKVSDQGMPAWTHADLAWCCLGPRVISDVAVAIHRLSHIEEAEKK